MKKYTAIWIAIVIFNVSCEKVMDFKGQTPDSKMYINTVVSADGSEDNSINVSESVFVFGGRAAQPVNDAIFKLWRNSEEVLVDHDIDENNERTRYSFSSPIVAGDKLELFGESPLLGRISSSDIVPYSVEIKKIDTEWFVEGGDDESYLRTLITIADRPVEENYYRVVIRSTTQERWTSEPDWWGEIVVEESERKRTHHVYMEREILFNNISGGLAGDGDGGDIFTDELFRDGEYTLDVYIQLDREYDNESSTWSGKTEIIGINVEVEIQTLSENLFMYERSRKLATAENNFSEPVRIFSNINGGYGIFGAYNTSKTSIELQL